MYWFKKREKKKSIIQGQGERIKMSENPICIERIKEGVSGKAQQKPEHKQHPVPCQFSIHILANV